MKTNQHSSRKTTKEQVTIGIDIGDQWSHYCILSSAGEVMEEGRFRTNAEALAQHFEDMMRARIAIENGAHSIWISEKLQA